MNQTQAPSNTQLISYCGFYCESCPKFTKNQCNGCKGDDPKCAVGYSSCKVRPCCIENGFSTCAECNKFESVKDCKIYNPLLIRFGQFITRTSRRKGIELIKKVGEDGFASFMKDKNWVTIKKGK